MNQKFYLLSLVLVFLFSACGTTNKSTNSNSNATTNNSSSYETVVIKGDLPSPRKEMKGKIGGTTINVNYGSPSVKGRAVWGGLVPNGKVWRTGANEATTIEVSNEIMVEGKKLPAGKYGFFAIPNDEEWVIIFNSVHNQWGAYEYDSSKDVLRVNVKPTTGKDHVEALDYALENNSLILKWEKLSVPIKIKG